MKRQKVILKFIHFEMNFQEDFILPKNHAKLLKNSGDNLKKMSENPNPKLGRVFFACFFGISAKRGFFPGKICLVTFFNLSFFFLGF